MRIAIVGGAGRMGRWFAGFLLKNGHEVVVTDRNETKLREIELEMGVSAADAEEAIKGADVVLISVPPDDFEEAVAQIYTYIRRGQIVVDITSMKVLPVAVMHRYLKHGLVLGIHPMFGVGARDVANQNFVLTPTNETETALAHRVRRYLEARGAHVTLMAPEEHDEMMAIVLGLTHFISLVAADTLLACGRLELGKSVAGGTYKVLLTMISSVVSQNPELTASLQMNLPGMTKIRRLLQEKQETWLALANNGDSLEFVRRVDALKEGLGKAGLDLEKAYGNMGKIVEGF